MKRNFLNFWKKQSAEKGFTMVELVISVAVLTFGIVGVYEIFWSLLLTTFNASNKLTAIYLAQEGLEIVRNIRDNNYRGNPPSPWNDGLSECELGCELDYKTKTTEESAENELQTYIDPGRHLYINPDKIYSYDTAGGTSTIFRRKITISFPNTDIMEAVSRVEWDYNGQSYNLEARKRLYNWQ